MIASLMTCKYKKTPKLNQTLLEETTSKGSSTATTDFYAAMESNGKSGKCATG